MRLSDLSNEQLNKAIWIVVALIVITLSAAGGYFAYKNYLTGNIPPLIQKEMDKAKQDIAKDPKNVEARIKLANLYIGENMNSEAKLELEQVLKINKNHIAALTLLGTVYESTGQDNQAVTYYKKAIAVAEKTEFKALNIYLYEAYYRLGSIYLKQKAYDKAIEVLKKDSSLNPMDSDLHYQLGQAYLKKGDADTAILEFSDALKYVPNYAEAYFGLGQAYEKKGDKPKAIEAYQNALKYKSDYEDAKKALEKLK